MRWELAHPFTHTSRMPSRSSSGHRATTSLSNCYVGGPHDLRQARETGHPQSDVGSRDTPFGGNGAIYARSAPRFSLDLPEAELNTLLATTAATVYGFALDRLQLVADRVGPTVAELQTMLPTSARPKYPDVTCCSVFREALHA